MADQRSMINSHLLMAARSPSLDAFTMMSLKALGPKVSFSSGAFFSTSTALSTLTFVMLCNAVHHHHSFPVCGCSLTGPCSSRNTVSRSLLRACLSAVVNVRPRSCALQAECMQQTTSSVALVRQRSYGFPIKALTALSCLSAGYREEGCSRKPGEALP